MLLQGRGSRGRGRGGLGGRGGRAGANNGERQEVLLKFALLAHIYLCSANPLCKTTRMGRCLSNKLCKKFQLVGTITKNTTRGPIWRQTRAAAF